jgi:hypothetical protein
MVGFGVGVWSVWSRFWIWIGAGVAVTARIGPVRVEAGVFSTGTGVGV